MSVPNRVLYSQGGRSYPALVLAAHSLNQSHLGENGEPTLHLAIVLDEPLVNGKPKVQPPGYIPQVTYIYDVVHASHKFDKEYMRQHGLSEAKDGDVNKVAAEAEIRNRRGAGEWSELPAGQVATESELSELREQEARYGIAETQTLTARHHQDLHDEIERLNRLVGESRTVEGDDLGRATQVAPSDASPVDIKE